MFSHRAVRGRSFAVLQARRELCSEVGVHVLALLCNRAYFHLPWLLHANRRRSHRNGLPRRAAPRCLPAPLKIKHKTFDTPTRTLITCFCPLSRLALPGRRCRCAVVPSCRYAVREICICQFVNSNRSPNDKNLLLFYLSFVSLFIGTDYVMVLLLLNISQGQNLLYPQ